MKVLQILPELHSGGVERGTLELARQLVKEKHESIVVSAGGRLVEPLESEGSRHIEMTVHKKSLVTLLSLPALRRLLLSEAPDIVHVRSRVPAILLALTLKTLKKAQRPKLVSTVHGLYSVSRYSEQMTRSDKVICVSDCVKKYVQDHYPKCPKSRLAVVFRGVDPLEFPRGYQADREWLFAWQKQYPETADKYLLVLPGRITRLKGHLDFLKILAENNHPKVHGLIVGGAHPKKQAYYEEVKKFVSEHNLENKVTFTGQRADIREIFSISDVVLSLSNKPESFGRTTLEALAIGVPVVGYDHGGVGEILRRLFPEGLVAKGDVSAVGEKIRDLLEGDKSVPEKNDVFLLENCLNQTVQIYKDLISS